MNNPQRAKSVKRPTHCRWHRTSEKQKHNHMKQLLILGLASAVCMAASVALGDDDKHPHDPRPPGTHEAVKETKVDAKVIGTNVTEKVRKDNKDSNVKESPKGGSEK